MKQAESCLYSSFIVPTSFPQCGVAQLCPETGTIPDGCGSHDVADDAD
jgi:hypothetical protein